MNNCYLIELRQYQTLLVFVEAKSLGQALELAHNQQGEVTQTYPPELRGFKVVRVNNNKVDNKDNG